MARLVVPHHPDRVFKDDWWVTNDSKSPSGYRALPIASDPLEAFAVELNEDASRDEVSLGSKMIALVEPFVRVEMFRHNGWAVVIGFYEPTA